MVSTSIIGAEAVHAPQFAVLMGLRCQKTPVPKTKKESWLSSFTLIDTPKAHHKPQCTYNKSSLLTLAFLLSSTTSTAF